MSTASYVFLPLCSFCQSWRFAYFYTSTVSSFILQNSLAVTVRDCIIGFLPMWEITPGAHQCTRFLFYRSIHSNVLLFHCSMHFRCNLKHHCLCCCMEFICSSIHKVHGQLWTVNITYGSEEKSRVPPIPSGANKRPPNKFQRISYPAWSQVGTTFHPFPKITRQIY